MEKAQALGDKTIVYASAFAPKAKVVLRNPDTTDNVILTSPKAWPIKTYLELFQV